MKKILVLFPHQLHENNALYEMVDTILIVEEYLFFRQYPFHKQKILFHIASMEYFSAYLSSKGKNVVYRQSRKTDKRKS